MPSLQVSITKHAPIPCQPSRPQLLRWSQLPQMICQPHVPITNWVLQTQSHPFAVLVPQASFAEWALQDSAAFPPGIKCRTGPVDLNCSASKLAINCSAGLTGLIDSAVLQSQTCCARPTGSNFKLGPPCLNYKASRPGFNCYSGSLGLNCWFSLWAFIIKLALEASIVMMARLVSIAPVHNSSAVLSRLQLLYWPFLPQLLCKPSWSRWQCWLQGTLTFPASVTTDGPSSLNCFVNHQSLHYN